VKASSNESKPSIKKEEDTALSKINEKFSTATEPRKSVSNSLKATAPAYKNAKTDRSNNKHIYARNIACIRREEFVKQRSVSKDRIENEKKDAAAKANTSKTDTETELINKTIDTIPQSKNTNKSKALQKQQQQTVSKQFTLRTKSQETFKKDTSASNDDNTSEKAENRVHASKSSELPLNESEKKDQEVIAEKNCRNYQKANRGANVRRSATFVAQYRNSTFSKQNQNNGTPNKTEYTLTYGKNLSYARNNPRTDRENAGRKNVQKDYVSTNSKFNRRIEELRTNGMENHAKRQNEAAALTCNRKDGDPTKTETLLIEIKESANNSNVDHAEQKPTTIEQSREETEATDVSKIDANQQDTVAIKKMIDKEINTPAHTSNNDKRTTESQTNVTHQNLKQENVQRATDNAKQLENNQSWCNASSVMQRNNTTSVNSQHSFQSMHFGMQQICAQTGDLSRQMSPWVPDCNRYYEQHFATEDPMRLGHILNTAFDAVPYDNTLHTVSNDVAISSPSTSLEIAIDRSRENSNALYRYAPHMHSRPVTSLSNFPGYSVSSGHGNRWNATLQEGGVHMEHPAYSVTQQPTAMVYKSGMFGPDDFNAHATNCLPHPVVYTPCMQTWNPQLQYSMPIFYNSPYAGYAVFPDTMTQSSELDDNSCLQQPKYISHAHMNNYVRNGRNYDPIDCAAQARNSIDNVPVKSDQYYKRYHDNCRAAYDVPRHIPPVSHARSQGMNFVPANANMGQRNAHYSQSPRYYRQNVNNTQVAPKKAHDQRIQDFICDENALEDIPPMISPKEFITSNMNLPSKNDQFAASAFKPEFKMNPNADYRPPLWQRYNNNFRRNTTCHDFSRDNGSPIISIGRGSYKGKKS
jgi:hypothetical protein